MLFTLLGLLSATLLGILYVALGTGASSAQPGWLDPLFWSLIAGGVVLDRRQALSAWFLRQRPPIQNVVVATLFLAVGVGVSVLFSEGQWTWHIPG